VLIITKANDTGIIGSQTFIWVVFVTDFYDIRDPKCCDIVSSFGLGVKCWAALDLENIRIGCDDRDQFLPVFLGFNKIKCMPRVHEIKRSKCNNGILFTHIRNLKTFEMFYLVFNLSRFYGFSDHALIFIEA